MSVIHLNLTYSSPDKKGAGDDDCVKKEVAGVGLSESTCGNGNSDLYKYLVSWINGGKLPTTSSGSNYGATIWAQDRVGNGYEVTVAKGTLIRENQVTTQNHELFNISPGKIVDGVIDLEELTGWAIDKIWSVSWSGYVTDTNGVSIAHPALIIDGTNIVLNPKTGVYGCLKIKYELTRDRLTINNDGSSGSSATSVSFNIDGCEEDELLQLPGRQCTDSLIEDPIDIKERIEGLIDGGEKDVDVEDRDPPTDSGKDLDSSYDYCTRKLISSDLANPPEYFGGSCENSNE